MPDSNNVLPDERGNCSFCGAKLHELTPDEANRLIDFFEDVALDRTRAWQWHAEEWLFDDEAAALAIAKETAAGHDLKVCIDTDSQVKSRETEFGTVIVFIRKGRGGFMYIRNETTTQKMSIKQRMLVEVAKSIEVAYALCEMVTRYGVEMEVHVDINTHPSFKSNTACGKQWVIS